MKMFDGDVSIAIEQGTIHLKACDNFGDPVELTVAMAKELASELLKMAETIDKDMDE